MRFNSQINKMHEVDSATVRLYRAFLSILHFNGQLKINHFSRMTIFPEKHTQIGLFH